MYSREEAFWEGRLQSAAAARVRKQQLGSGSPQAPAFLIPAHRHDAPAGQPPGAADAVDSPALRAQVEALKLQCAALRADNLRLSAAVAAAGAERAAASKKLALDRLAELQIDAGGGPAGGVASEQPGCSSSGGGGSGSRAAALQALQEEAGVALAPEAESVPLHYLQQMHACFLRRLEQARHEHEQQLQARLKEHKQQLQRQAEAHARELALLADSRDDPAREAEAALLRDDNRYLKAKLRELGEEYQRRVTVAAEEARLAARRQAAEEQQAVARRAADDLQRLQQQLDGVQRQAAAAGEAAEEAAALERARHAAEVARLREQHAAQLAQVEAQCAAEVEQRERLSADYLALLVELRAVRAAMSAAPSRAETRQEQHAVGAGPSQPHERHMQAGPSPSWQHGQLLEPEEEEEEARWLQAAAGPWEQPRHAPVPAPLPRRG